LGYCPEKTFPFRPESFDAHFLPRLEKRCARFTEFCPFRSSGFCDAAKTNSVRPARTNLIVLIGNGAGTDNRSTAQFTGFRCSGNEFGDSKIHSLSRFQTAIRLTIDRNLHIGFQPAIMPERTELVWCGHNRGEGSGRFGVEKAKAVLQIINY